MSHIDKLIADLCPNGIEFKPLGDMGSFTRGNGLQKTDLLGEGTPAIHYGQVHTLYGAWTTQTKSFVSPELASKLRRAKQGDLVIATTSEDDDAVAKATAWLGRDEAAVSGDAYIYRHCLDPKYVAYFFQSGSFQEKKKRHITGAKVRRISGEALGKIRIPVPPLEVQREIARVLDKFTQLEAELEAELKAELEARHRQYEYWQNQLLAFRGTEGVQWVPMGKIGTLTRGRRFTRKDMTSSGVPCIHYGEIYTHYGVSTHKAISHVRDILASKLRYAKPGDVVIAGVGETVKDVAKAVAWLGETPVAIHDDTFSFRSKQDPTYISYAMQTVAFQEQKERWVSRAKVKRIGNEGISQIVIPVPPLEEQRRIVSILDKFDSLVNDLSIGLPAELAARRKQYEYYRDRLLTFEEKR